MKRAVVATIAVLSLWLTGVVIPLGNWSPTADWNTNEPAGYTLLYDRNMDADPPMPVAPTAADADGWQITQGDDHVETVTEGGRTYMRMVLPAGTALGNSDARWFAGTFPETVDCFYFRADLRWSQEWEDGLYSTKLFFPDGDAQNHYVDGINDYGAGPPYVTGIRLQNDGDCGNDNIIGAAEIPIGEWMQLETQWCSNTPGSSDGIGKIWVNGVLDVDDSTVCYTSTGDTPGFTTIFFDPIYGHNSGGSATTEDLYLDLDNAYLSYLEFDEEANCVLGTGAIGSCTIGGS